MPQRQADRLRRRAHRRRDGGREAHHQGRGPAPGGARGANQLLRPVFEPRPRPRPRPRRSSCWPRGCPPAPAPPPARSCSSPTTPRRRPPGARSSSSCRHETSPEDIRGMNASEGFLTAFGGMTSHAALVARQMGKVCIVGCDARQLRLPRAHHDGEHRRADPRSSRRATGSRSTASPVRSSRAGSRPPPRRSSGCSSRRTSSPSEAPVYQDYAKLMSWADGIRRLRVRANADQPDQAAAAVAFGAEGIGLCRTEHMFFGEGKIGPMREMIVASNEQERRAALAKLLPLQREDFAGIFRAMGGRPVTIRTLDPPLHEFLPHDEAGIAGAGPLDRQVGRRRSRRASPICTSPTPCSVTGAAASGISYPEITEMQARAIFEAACDVAERRHGGRARGDDPARGHQEGARPAGRDRARRRPSRSSPSGASGSSTWWAR